MNFLESSRAETQRRRGVVSKIFLNVKLTFVLLVAFMVLGCQNDDDLSGNLHGIWTNNAGGFITTIIIDTHNNTIEYVDSYKGTIVNSPDFSAAHGVLIIEFTKYLEQDFSNWPEVTSIENPDNIGKFGALYWRDLTFHSVFMADAFTGWTRAMFETFDEAQTYFTLARVGDYVDWSIVGAYTR